MITGFTLNDKVYNFLKWFTLIFLPAVSAAYFSLSGTLDLPNAEQVVGTIAVVTTFLGAVLGISSHNYQGDGQVVIENDFDREKTIYGLELNRPPEDIADMKQITLMVDDQRPVPGPGS